MDKDFSIGLGAGLIFGFLLGGMIFTYIYKDEAIQKGNAEHDAKTGAWRWIDHSVKGKQ